MLQHVGQIPSGWPVHPLMKSNGLVLGVQSSVYQSAHKEQTIPIHLLCLQISRLYTNLSRIDLSLQNIF